MYVGFYVKVYLSIYLFMYLYVCRNIIIHIYNEIKEARRGVDAQSVVVKSTGCGFDPHSRKWNIYLNLYFHFFALSLSRQSAAMSSATQHTMPPKFGGKWGTACLNTGFPLPTLLCAGYSVKLIYEIVTDRLSVHG